MKISRISSVALLAGGASSQQTPWGQCGGNGWTGLTQCVSGYVCTYQNDWYSQCLAGTATTTSTTSAAKATTSSTKSSSTLSTSTKASSTLSTSTKALTTSTSTKATTSTTSVLTTSSTSKATTSTTVAKATTTSTTSAASSTATGVKHAGINISGFDFGCDTWGDQTVSSVQPPVKSLGGADGAGQMSHFVKDDNLNTFRLPVGWQYLVNSVLGGTLNAANFANYDLLVQACLATGASCIIDIHNYARWNGAVVGQGGPTNDQFANLWAQLAQKYASESNIIFGVMNEPHDLTIATWATTVQAAVTAIRGAGASSQTILLPGTDYSGAATFISSGSAAALSAITNPDGTTTNLVFDVHKYLDSNNSGTDTTCVTNNIDSCFSTLATWLRTNKREAFVSETGGGNTASCLTYLCQEIAYLNENADVFLGYTGWAAGSFASTYELTETPTLSGTTWTDTTLVAACLAR